MSRRCQLRSWPWEILHDVFDYLTPFDLFRSFGSIDEYLTDVLRSYSRLNCNFQSIRKCQFDAICQFIRPEQVQSLILSDDRWTCGQMDMFVSRFHLDEFVQLQSLVLREMSDSKLFERIFARLEDHRRIRSISMIQCSTSINRRLSRLLTEVLSTLPSLGHLRFFQSSPLNTLKRDLTQLTHLRLDHCLFSDLDQIIRHLPNLFFLRVFIPYQDEQPRLTCGASRLKKFIIKCQRWFSWSDVENFFSLFPSLECLIFESGGERDLLDARRWQDFIERHLKHLTRFEMNIHPEENTFTANEVLQQFQNSFWINEKHCQFACLISTTTDTCVQLFTIPHFAPKECWYPASEGFVHHSIVPFVFEEHCSLLKVSDLPSIVALPSPLTGVRTLALQCSVEKVEQIEAILQISSVRHLEVAKNIECRPLAEVLQAGLNITRLTVYHQTLFPLINSNNSPVFPQIKSLTLMDMLIPRETDRLCHVFPKLEDLSLLINERGQVLRVTNALPDLKSAVFRWPSSLEKSIDISTQSLEDNQMTFRLSRPQLELWMN